METNTKIMLGLVGVGVTIAVIYMMSRKRTVATQVVGNTGVVPPVSVINYSNSKPTAGLNAFSDRAKPVMGGQNLQSQSDQMNPKNSVFKQRMGA